MRRRSPSRGCSPRRLAAFSRPKATNSAAACGRGGSPRHPGDVCPNLVQRLPCRNVQRLEVSAGERVVRDEAFVGATELVHPLGGEGGSDNANEGNARRARRVKIHSSWTPITAKRLEA